MVIVASTQAEPVVRPYYEGIPQQVQGLLSGPAASGLYIQMVPTISKKDAQVFWTPFSVAVLLVSGLILIMGCYYAIMALYHRSRGSSEHEE